jgi:hypothetical protein
MIGRKWIEKMIRKYGESVNEYINKRVEKYPWILEKGYRTWGEFLYYNGFCEREYPEETGKFEIVSSEGEFLITRDGVYFCILFIKNKKAKIEMIWNSIKGFSKRFVLEYDGENLERKWLER